MQQVCREAVLVADVYVLVYGPLRLPVRDQPDVSYTELEFDIATAAGKPGWCSSAARTLTDRPACSSIRNMVREGPHFREGFARPG